MGKNNAMTTIEELEAALEWFNSHYAPSECKHYKHITKSLTQAIAIKKGECVVQKSERQILFEAVDRMGWKEIRAFQEELKKGQSIHEDAGGYFMRCYKRLFGIAPREEVITYKGAMKAMIAAQEERG